jgi:hypothetical protein
MLKEEAIIKIKNAGLLVASIDPDTKFGNGYSIAKPKYTAGNARENYEFEFGSEEIVCDAPGVTLYPNEQGWGIEVWDWVPGPGPGDFQQFFSSIDEAVLAILDYYFGDPLLMNPPDLLNID